MASKQLATDNTSVRAKSKVASTGVDPTRKTVFRPVLDNPLIVQWPPLSAPIRKLILDELILFLQTPLEPTDLPIADWRLQEHARRRGRVHGAGKANAGAKRGEGSEDAAPPAALAKAQTETELPKSTPQLPAKTHDITLRSKNVVAVPDFVDKPRPVGKAPPTPLPRPQLLNHLSIGINEVTRALETRIRWGRWELGDPSAAPGGGRKDVATPDAAKPTKRRRLHSKDPSAIPPLDPLHPTSSITLNRPSYRFLFHPLPKPNTRLPPYLLPPTETNPFFRVLANEHRLKNKVGREKESRERKGFGRRDVEVALLGDVIKEDHRKLERSLIGKGEKVETGRKEKGKGKQTGRAAQKSTKAGAAKSANKAAAATTETFMLDMDLTNPGTNSSAVTFAEPPPLDPGNKEGESDEPAERDCVNMIDIIFVCKPDINPPSLIDHLPSMVAAANGVTSATQGVLDSAEEPPESGMDVDGIAKPDGIGRPASRDVFLVQLDLGAEFKLGDVLALRRVAALGLSSLAPGTSSLLSLVRQHVSPISAPWLVPHISNPPAATTPEQSRQPRTLIQTHVKHLRTSAPKDIKGANAATKLARKEAKKRKRGGGAAEKDVYMAED
ncbi:ribonuclease P/MRP protein subunit POP3, partial [Phenoliferia sp. Uapishka_3]